MVDRWNEYSPAGFGVPASATAQQASRQRATAWHLMLPMTVEAVPNGLRQTAEYQQLMLFITFYCIAKWRTAELRESCNKSANCWL
jgi:hypothetical protein